MFEENQNKDKDLFSIGQTRVQPMVAWSIIIFVALVNLLITQKLLLDAPAGVYLANQDSGEKASVAKFVPGELLIRFKDQVSAVTQTQSLKNWGFSVKDEIKQIKVKAISVPEGAEEALAEALSHNPKIDFAEVNRIIEPVFIPNDPQYGSQWHHATINSPTAWDSVDGSTVKVAIGDTGVYSSHPDLSAHLLMNLAQNFYAGGTDVTDVYGHGTKTIGAIAAVGNNSNQVAGVAFNSPIIPMKVTSDSGYAYTSTIASAITYSADNGAKVASFSFDVCINSSTVAQAANYMRQKGGLVFLAAGNTGTDRGYSSDTSTICVSATDGGDNFASWSSFGNIVDLSAPGVSILTTLVGGGTGSVSGTSFSSPVAAGVGALVFAANPSLTPDQVQQILFSSARDLGTTGWDQYYGWGRVDAGAAVTLAKNTQGPPPDTTAPSTSITSPANGSTVSGQVSIAVNAMDNVGVSKVELYKDGALFTQDNSSPYNFLWNTTVADNGSHTLQSKAYDTAGNSGLSSIITVNVNNVPDTTPPNVEITQISTAKSNVNISVSASDNIGVAQIDILVDGTLYKSCYNATTCSVRASTRKLSFGAHTILANAYDAAGNKGSATGTFTK